MKRAQLLSRVDKRRFLAMVKRHSTALPPLPPPANTNPPTRAPSVHHLVQQSANRGMSERGRELAALIMGPEAAAAPSEGEKVVVAPPEGVDAVPVQQSGAQEELFHYIGLGWGLHSRVEMRH